MSRYDLTDFEWRVIKPLLPNKPRALTLERNHAGAVMRACIFWEFWRSFAAIPCRPTDDFGPGSTSSDSAAAMNYPVDSIEVSARAALLRSELADASSVTWCQLVSSA
jgi:transposase